MNAILFYSKKKKKKSLTERKENKERDKGIGHVTLSMFQEEEGENFTLSYAWCVYYMSVFLQGSDAWRLGSEDLGR